MKPRSLFHATIVTAQLLFILFDSGPQSACAAFSLVDHGVVQVISNPQPQPKTPIAFTGHYGLATSSRYYYSHAGQPSFYGQPNIPYDGLAWAASKERVILRDRARANTRYAYAMRNAQQNARYATRPDHNNARYALRADESRTWR